MPYESRKTSSDGSTGVDGSPRERSATSRGRTAPGSGLTPGAQVPTRRRSRLVEAAIWVWDVAGFVIEWFID